LIAVLHATAPLLYDVPRYAWTYKHIGVIDYLATHGTADRSIDVYQNWPGFFALNAWFSHAAGIAPLDYAGWAQAAFELANVAAILFAVRGVTRDTRAQWTAVWCFLVANWIGQDYLAPQAFGFVLVTLILGLILRCVPPRAARTRAGRRRDALLERISTLLARGRRPVVTEAVALPLSPVVALLVGAFCCIAVIVSHQLSPIMLILSTTALFVMTGRPPWWAIAGIVALEGWWLFLSYDFVSTHFRFFSFDFAATARPQGTGLPGSALGVDAARAGMALTVALAGAGLVRRLRAGHLDVAPMTLAAAPVLVMAFQSYGGEAPLRAYLFALPWLGVLVAAACESRTIRGCWRLLAATVAIGTCTLFGYYGQELVNYMTRNDVAASRWYFDHAPAGASLTFIAPNFPDRLNARYAAHLDAPPALVEAPGYRPHLLGPADVRSLETLLDRNHAPARFVALTGSGERYARFYGLAPQGSFARMGRALMASPNFRLVYRGRNALIFAYKLQP
jgi:hypothetical protein